MERPPPNRQRLALELLIGELLHVVPLGALRNVVLSVRESLAEIGDGWKQPEDAAPALMLLAARELAELAMPPDADRPEG
jgi:hypothetical protein